MGVSRSLVIFALVVAIAPAISSATQFTVGDDSGWKLGVNYTEWAQGKQFFVGDTLVFTYNNASHNVYKVINGTGFKNCTVPKNNSLRLSTGNDIITLATSGDKWYICGVTGHCGKGMKFKITVLEAAPVPSNSTAPVPSNSTTPPSNSASGLRATHPIFHIYSGMIFAVVSMIMAN